MAIGVLGAKAERRRDGAATVEPFEHVMSKRAARRVVTEHGRVQARQLAAHVLLALQAHHDAHGALYGAMIAVQQLPTAPRARVGEPAEVAARDEDVVELVLQLGARVLPRAVVRLLKEGGERGELVHLEEGAQLPPRGVDMLKTIRPHSARALLRASGEAASANARVRVRSSDDHVALMALGEHRAKRVVVILPL